MMIDVWAPRNDHPGRKAMPFAAPNEPTIEQNPNGCRGLRNPPGGVSTKRPSATVMKKAEKMLKEDRTKLSRMKKALR